MQLHRIRGACAGGARSSGTPLWPDCVDAYLLSGCHVELAQGRCVSDEQRDGASDRHVFLARCGPTCALARHASVASAPRPEREGDRPAARPAGLAVAICLAVRSRSVLLEPRCVFRCHSVWSHAMFALWLSRPWQRVASLAAGRPPGRPKSTLVRDLAANEYRARFFNFDDELTANAARSDSTGFVADIAGPAVIDEIQRAPGDQAAPRRKPGSRPVPAHGLGQHRRARRW